MKRLILALPGNEKFAARLADRLDAELGHLETRRFPDGESYVRLRADPAGRVVDLVCTLANPDQQFLPLVFAADAARQLGATEVGLVAPYLAYMRQDKRFLDGEAITSLSFARLVSLSFDRLLTVDPHLHRYPALQRLYSIPTTTLHAAGLLADWIAANVDAPLVIGPDVESEQWAGAIAARIGAPHAVLSKIRYGDRQVEIAVPDLSAWRDRTPVLVDDIVSSGRTLAVAAGKLVDHGLRQPECVVVHPLFADNAWNDLRPRFARITSTDALAHASNGISLVSLVAESLAGNSRDPLE